MIITNEVREPSVIDTVNLQDSIIYESLPDIEVKKKLNFGRRDFSFRLQLRPSLHNQKLLQ